MGLQQVAADCEEPGRLAELAGQHVRGLRVAGAEVPNHGGQVLLSLAQGGPRIGRCPPPRARQRAAAGRHAALVGDVIGETGHGRHEAVRLLQSGRQLPGVRPVAYPGSRGGLVQRAGRQVQKVAQHDLGHQSPSRSRRASASRAASRHAPASPSA